ncbi:MAG: 3-oxoadipyl-CoA thiolase [Aestuariivita sp.]|nr:3-oxoadipyl-CoA thiolase [Aestuariivita sp.]
MEALICDAVRTPIGRYGGALSSIRTDDLAALPIKALKERNPSVDWRAVDDVVLGCANQAGEDNRNIARMAALLAGLAPRVPGITLNRLCASGLDAVGFAARAIKAGDCDITVAGGVESMSRAPYVLSKATSAFSRSNQLFDTTMGWRFINSKLKNDYGVESMPETADNVASDYGISREDQDTFAARSQARWKGAHERGVFSDEIIPVTLSLRDGQTRIIDQDEHPRPDTTVTGLRKLKGINHFDRSVTAGNSSGINDGAVALLIVSDKAAQKHKLEPLARVIGMSATGVEPRIMGIGPVSATKKLLNHVDLHIDQMDVIELNEAFAAQVLATLRELSIADDDPRVNPNGGAIAIGHPLGMSGARLVTSAVYELRRTSGRYALCTMCVGVGQGCAIILERV